MQLQFTDALQIGTPRRTKDGYLAVRARSARTGVYQYSGREIDPNNEHGLRDLATVNVLRDENTVFDKAAAHSFVGKPITIDHPNQAVNSANWKDHARGAVMGALRDGEYLAFDLLLMDASAIADVDAGKRELSNGYAAELEFGDFEAPGGVKCPVRQARITDGNHIAIVKAGRAGPECRISDGGNNLFETCDAATIVLNVSDALEEKPVPKKIMLDGLQVDLSDEAAVETAITKLQGQINTLTTAKDAAETSVATLTAADAAKAAEIVALKQAVTDAKVTPAQLRDAGKAYDKLVSDAKRLAPSLTIGDEMDEAAIRKAAVDAKLGDAAKDFTDAQIETAFATSIALLGDTGQQHHDPIRQPVIANDSKVVEDAYSEMIQDMQNASKPRQAQAA